MLVAEESQAVRMGVTWAQLMHVEQVATSSQVAGTPYDNYPGDGYGAAPTRGDFGSGLHGMPDDGFNDEVRRGSTADHVSADCDGIRAAIWTSWRAVPDLAFAR